MSGVFIVDGGRPLNGEIRVGGAKNSALKLLAATLLASGRSRIHRVPRIGDVDLMLEVLTHLGCTTAWVAENTVEVDVPIDVGYTAPYELVSRMRASTAVLGALLARTGRAKVAHPGGCNLGPRPIDLHIRGLEQLGAEIQIEGGYINARCSRLVGAQVRLEYASVGATENLLMAASLASGKTIVYNAAREPEIGDLADFLNVMGARITGAGTATIEIDGVDALVPAEHAVVADRIEAGTWMFAAATAGGDVTVRDMRPDHLELVIDKFTEFGVDVSAGQDYVRVIASGRPLAADVSTLPYPGFPTDLQPFAVALLLRAQGTSIVTENLYARFMFIGELVRMGADVRTEGHYAVIRGVGSLAGVPVKAPDLRAGAALVVAGLAAQGRTIVSDIHHVERGYEEFAVRLSSLGARVERASDYVGVA